MKFEAMPNDSLLAAALDRKKRGKADWMNGGRKDGALTNCKERWESGSYMSEVKKSNQGNSLSVEQGS